LVDIFTAQDIEMHRRVVPGNIGLPQGSIWESWITNRAVEAKN
jgi:hypothetical protein